MLNNAEQFFSPAVLHGDALVADHPVQVTGISTTIKRLFIDSKDESALYTDAVLALTMFNSDKVKSSAYDLLFKKVSKQMDASHVLNHLQIHVCPRKAACLRLFNQFQYIARKYAHQMISETVKSHFNHKMYISFALEAIKTLCHHTFHEQSTSSSLSDLIDINRPGSIAFIVESNPRYLIGMKSDLNTAGVELLSNSFSSYATALHNSNHSKKGHASLLAVTAKYMRYFDTPVEDCASDVSRDMIILFMRDINNLALSPSGKSKWSSLDANQQFFVNAMMDVCATICVKRPTLVIELLPTISKVAISIVWDSVGASRVVELYCEYCDICEYIDEGAFLRKMDKLFIAASCDDKPKVSMIRLLHAILASKRDTKLVRHCHSFVDKHLLSDGSMRKYILLDMPEPTSDDIEFHFQVLRLFATFAKISKTSILAKIKACLTVEFCTELLTSSCPLQIKMCAIIFCEKIYDSSELPLLSYIAMDLNNVSNQIFTKHCCSRPHCDSFHRASL